MERIKLLLLLIWLILPSLVLLSSCTSPQFVKTNEVNFNMDGPFGKVVLITGEMIEFGSEYGDATSVRKDTLIGRTSEGVLRKIPLNSIQEVEIGKPATGKTLLLISGIVVLAIVISLVLYMTDRGGYFPRGFKI